MLVTLRFNLTADQDSSDWIDRLINGNGCPTRGYNKKGQLCWRTYKTVDEAKANLLG